MKGLLTVGGVLLGLTACVAETPGVVTPVTPVSDGWVTADPGSGQVDAADSGSETGADVQPVADADVAPDVATDLGPQDAPSEPDAAELPPLELPDSESPVPLPAGYAFAADVPYGPWDRQKFDLFYRPDDAQPVPLVIYIHGGGFTGGSKQSLYGAGNQSTLAALAQGQVALAAINYRLLEDVDATGVGKPLGDCRRALQFLRAHAPTLNIDPTRVALFGGSAGAGASLWLGTHDDMAEPGKIDPVLHQSTRVTAVALTETQATYDIVRWETDIFAPYDFTLQMAIDAGMEQRLLSFYGITDIADLDSPMVQAYRADVDMLALMDAGDAPVWVRNAGQDEVFPTDTGILFHHPYHAEWVMDVANAVGLEVVAKIPALGVEDPTNETLPAFLLRHLGAD